MKDEMAEKKLKALAMRRAGYSFEDIAKELGYSDRSAAWRLIHREYDKRISTEVAQAKLEELERLDALQRPLWEKAMAGDVQATETILRIIQVRSKLLGLEKTITDQKLEVVFVKDWRQRPWEKDPETQDPQSQDVEVQYTTDWKPRLEGGAFDDLLPGTQDPEDPADD